MRKNRSIVLIAFLLMDCSILTAQSVTFELKTNPTVDFTFNTINKYVNGIIIPDVITLNVEATGTQWDLYVGSSTLTAGTWDNIQYYSSTGNSFPPVGILQVAFRNSSGTTQVNSFAAMQDIASTTLDVIGNHQAAPDPPVNCSDPVPVGTNTSGSYLTDPQCYQFRVDFRVVPGLTYRAGLYTLQVEFIVARDL